MFFNRTYFDLLFLFLDILLDDFDPLDEPCIVDCCATSAEFSRGFLVEVPVLLGSEERKIFLYCWNSIYKETGRKSQQKFRHIDFVSS